LLFSRRHLGLPDAEDMLLKSTIVIELRRLIKRRKLTQTANQRSTDCAERNPGSSV
jgi:predicted XRE-type DNA-binding protein